MNEAPTPQEQINHLRVRAAHDRRLLRRAIKVMIAVGFLWLIGLVATGWQIGKAFKNQDHERLARIGASASINTFLCQRIDSVGNGVAALVRVSLRNSPPPAELPAAQRQAYHEFLVYAEEQEKPPRCRELALKVATLTGADPADIEITPIHLHRKPSAE